MHKSYLLTCSAIAGALILSSQATAQDALNITVREALQQALRAQRDADEALNIANEAKARADTAVRQALALIDQGHDAKASDIINTIESTETVLPAQGSKYGQHEVATSTLTILGDGQGPCDKQPEFDASAMASAATQWCTNFSSNGKRAYSLNDLAFELGLTQFNDYKKKSAPVFSLSTAKEGDYSGLGFNFRARRYVPLPDNTYRSNLWSVTPQVVARVDKNKVPVLREYNAKDDATAWSSNLSLKLDVRRAWGYRYDLYDARQKLEKKLKALINKCEDNGRPCTERSSLYAVDGAKDAYWDAVASLWGLDKEGGDLPPQYYVGGQFQKGWNEVAYRPYFDPITDTTILPADPSTLAGDELKMKQHPLRFKLYGGASTRFTLDKDAKNTPGDADKYFVIGLAGSMGWRRGYGLSEGTVEQDLCFPDAVNVNYTKCIKSNTSKPYRSQGFTLGTSLNVISADLPVIGKPWLSIGYERDFDLKQDIWSVPVTFAVDGDGKLRGGMKWKWTGTGTTPDGTAIKRTHSLVFTLEQTFDWPIIP